MAINRDATKKLLGVIRDAEHERPGSALCGAWIDDQGRQCVCDGFRAFRLADRADLPAPPNGAKPPNLNQIWPTADEIRGYVPLPTPPLDAVKASYLVQREAWRNAPKGVERPPLTWTFPDGPKVQAAYLIDALTVLPYARILHNPDDPNAPIVLQANRDDALILPLRAATQEPTPEPKPESFPVPPVPVPAKPEPSQPTGKETRGIVPEKTFRGQELTGNGWTIYFDDILQRTRVTLSKPTDAAKAAVTAAGFFWSNTTESYHKKLSMKAFRAAQALAAQLDVLCAA